MIDYSSYKKLYTTGGEFFLTGTDYTGYVEIFNGVPCQAGTRKLLTPLQTFSTDLANSVYFCDRLLNDSVNLPYTKEDILIAPNDHFTFSLFKDRLDKLRINNTYTYSRLFIPNNNIPVTDNVTFAALKNSNDTSLTLLTTFEGNVAFAGSSDFKALDRVKRFVGKRNTDLFDNFAFFCISDTEFISLTSNRIETSVIEVSDKYETVENELKFKQLHSLSVNDKFLYISDTGNNVILKYEVAGYFNNDYALANRRNFIEVIGGEGAVTDPSRFKGPKEIACSNIYVAVHDSGNYIIKVYDTNFNYVQQLRGIPLRKEPLAALEFNPILNTLYALTYIDTNRLKIYIYDANLILQEQYLIEEVLEPGELVNNITFSYNDSNFWYINTNFYTYKKLVNRPDRIVGKFQTSNLYSNNINTYLDTKVTNYATGQTTRVTATSTVSASTIVQYLSASTITASLTAVSSLVGLVSSLSSITTTSTLISTTSGTAQAQAAAKPVVTRTTEPVLSSTTLTNILNNTIEYQVPINNHWDFTQTNYDKSKYFWNTILTKTEQFKYTVIKPYQFYRFVMFWDENLTKVRGGEPSVNKTNSRAYTGLLDIKLDVAASPSNNFFNGFIFPIPKDRLKTTEPTSTTNKLTYTIRDKNIFKLTPLNDYIVTSYVQPQKNYGVYYERSYQAFLQDYRIVADVEGDAGWVPAVSGQSATIDNAYLEIALPGPISLSGIRVLAEGSGTSKILPPEYVKVYGSNDGTTFVGIASAKLPHPNNVYRPPGRYITADIYEETVSTQSILSTYTTTSVITSLSTYTWTKTVTSADPVTQDILFFTVTNLVSGINMQYNTNDFTVLKEVLSTYNYQVSFEKLSSNYDGIVNDSFKSCRVVPSIENYDDIILFSTGRIYFIKEANEFKSVLKFKNFENFGLNAFTLSPEEYIQASTLNKELYKVVHDIFTLKNNIVGRFSGKLDKSNIVVLDDYNYNIDYFNITEQQFIDEFLSVLEFEKFYINENEKSILGVLNRVLTNIYDLQERVIDITRIDTETSLIPMFNSAGELILQ